MILTARSQLILVTSLVLAGLLSAQNIVPTPQTASSLPDPSALPAATPALTLDEAVERALAANFDVRIERNATSAARDEAIIADSDYNPTLSVTTGLSRDQSAGGFNGTIFVPSNLFDQRQSRVSVSQKISTGATMTVSGRLDRNTRNSDNPIYNSDAALAIRQPLLRGAGRTTNLAAIQRSKLGIESADLSFKGTVLTIVRDVETAYSNLVFSRHSRDVRAFSLAVAQKLSEEAQAKRDSGVATDLDVLQSEVGVANAQRNLLLATQSVRNDEDRLLALFGDLSTEHVGPVALPEFDDLPTTDFTHSYQLALATFPDHAAALVAVEQARINVDVNRRNRLPTLDLTGAVGLNSQEPAASTALSSLPSGDGYSWQAGLTLTVPWGLAADRARYRQARSSLNTAETRLLQIDQSILVAVRNTVRSVETNKENVRISKLASELSDRQFELEKARFDAGLSTFRRVQESREERDTARVNELQAQVNLRVALADLARLEGSTLERYQIDLAQH